jgi:hypothetical protein
MGRRGRGGRAELVVGSPAQDRLEQHHEQDARDRAVREDAAGAPVPPGEQDHARRRGEHRGERQRRDEGEGGRDEREQHQAPPARIHAREQQRRAEEDDRAEVRGERGVVRERPVRAEDGPRRAVGVVHAAEHDQQLVDAGEANRLEQRQGADGDAADEQPVDGARPVAPLRQRDQHRPVEQEELQRADQLAEVVSRERVLAQRGREEAERERRRHVRKREPVERAPARPAAAAGGDQQHGAEADGEHLAQAQARDRQPAAHAGDDRRDRDERQRTRRRVAHRPQRPGHREQGDDALERALTGPDADDDRAERQPRERDERGMARVESGDGQGRGAHRPNLSTPARRGVNRP